MDCGVPGLTWPVGLFAGVVVWATASANYAAVTFLGLYSPLVEARATIVLGPLQFGNHA